MESLADGKATKQVSDSLWLKNLNGTILLGR